MKGREFGDRLAIDWSHEPQWYDKELSQVLGQSGQRNRRVDLLARVCLQNGQEQWILLRVEIQTSYEPDFAVRISLYNAGLYWVFKRRVLTLVVLADLTRGWRPEEDVFQIGTFESRLKFPVCKLIQRLGVEWHDDHSLPVLFAHTQIEALRTAGDPEGRYRDKWLLVHSLLDLGYNAGQVREIFRLIDWMMHLRVDLEARFERGLAEFEEERAMPYVTSVERIAEARGEARVEKPAGRPVAKPAWYCRCWVRFAAACPRSTKTARGNRPPNNSSNWRKLCCDSSRSRICRAGSTNTPDRRDESPPAVVVNDGSSRWCVDSPCYGHRRKPSPPVDTTRSGDTNPCWPCARRASMQPFPRLAGIPAGGQANRARTNMHVVPDGETKPTARLVCTVVRRNAASDRLANAPLTNVRRFIIPLLRVDARVIEQTVALRSQVVSRRPDLAANANAL